MRTTLSIIAHDSCLFPLCFLRVKPTNRCFLHRATHESVAMVVLLIAPLKESQSERHAHPGEESRHAQPENKATPRKGRSCGRVEAGDRWRRKFFEDHGTPPPGAHRCSLAVELDFVSGEGRPLLILVFCSWISFFGLPIKSYSAFFSRTAQASTLHLKKQLE